MAALLSGSLNIALTKGTLLHKRIGYFYSISMMILIITSFMMYNLFGGWGIFHWTAMISLLTLLSGMIPMLIKRPA